MEGNSIQERSNVCRLRVFEKVWGTIERNQQILDMEFHSAVFSCTSNGALSYSSIPELDNALVSEEKANLPMNLCDWKLARDHTHFAYGGEEVNLSIWDVSRTFGSTVPEPQSEPTGKRKREQLLPAEVWRAKNVMLSYLRIVWCSRSDHDL